MKNLIDKFRIKSLKWKLLFRFIMILVILLAVMGIFQYISMREYLYKTKVQVLQERFHNLDMEALSKENLDNITEDASKEILRNLWDKTMSVAIINSNGEVVGKRCNSETPKDDKDGDDEDKEDDKEDKEDKEDNKDNKDGEDKEDDKDGEYGEYGE